jgi:peptidoglycan/xylan/chitin deacetylase (PgdA/CDA1 family)
VNPKPWRPGAVLQGSAVVHAAAVASVIAVPSLWPPALGVILANHALLAAGGLWPRSTVLGPNMVRLPHAAAARGEIALTIDDGPDPDVTPRVLELLAAAGARASFFCIGERALRHPELVRDMVREGHTIENHTFHHYHWFGAFGPRRMAREIELAQECLTDVAGRAPQFFRAVAGLRNPFLDPILHRLNLRLASWTRRAFDTQRRDPARACTLLTRNLAAGDILDMHDGNAATALSGEPMILAVLPRLLESIRDAGLKPVSLLRTRDELNAQLSGDHL